MANGQETGIETLRLVIARHSAPQWLEFGPRSPSGPAVRGRISRPYTWPLPDSFAQTPRKPLPRGGRPYMTASSEKSSPIRSPPPGWLARRV